MSEHKKLQNIPKRKKLDWSRSQDSGTNSEYVNRTQKPTSNPLGLSLDSKLKHYSESLDLVEDGRPLRPRENLAVYNAKHRDEKESSISPKRKKTSDSTTLHKHTDSSINFLSSIWQNKCSNSLKSKNQSDTNSCNSLSSSFSVSGRKDVSSQKTKNLVSVLTESEEDKTGQADIEPNQEISEDAVDSRTKSQDHREHFVDIESVISNDFLNVNNNMRSEETEKITPETISTDRESVYKADLSTRPRNKLDKGKVLGNVENFNSDEPHDVLLDSQERQTQSLVYTHCELNESMNLLPPKITNSKQSHVEINSSPSDESSSLSHTECDSSEDMTSSTTKEYLSDDTDCYEFVNDLMPELPPSPPRSTGFRNVRSYFTWNTSVNPRRKPPRVINLKVYYGIPKYGSNLSFYSGRSKPTTKSENEQYKNPDIDLGFDKELLSESLAANKSDFEQDGELDWQSNYAYNQNNHSWDTLDDSIRELDNTVARMSGLSLEEQNYQRTSVSNQEEDINPVGHQTLSQQIQTKPTSAINRNPLEESFFEKKGFFSSDKSNTRESKNSQNLIEGLQNTRCFEENNTHTSNLEDKSLGSASYQKGDKSAFNSQDMKSEARSQIRDSQKEHGFQDDSRHPEELEDENQVSQNSTYRKMQFSDLDKHLNNSNMQSDELLYHTFEENANVPWECHTEQFEITQSAPHDAYSNGLQHSSNMFPDEIKKYPISSKTLSYPNYQSISHTNEINSTSSYNTSGQEIAGGNTLYNYNSEQPLGNESNMDHIHDTMGQPSYYDENNMDYMSPDSESYITAAIQRTGCGNCPNCNTTEMMDTMEALAKSAGFLIHDVLPDGNCMFRSIVDQLRMNGDLVTTAGKLRGLAVEYLTKNPCSEDGTHMKDFLLTETWEQYLERMRRDGEWGDEISLRGISEVLKRRICIISAVGKQHNQITIQPSNIEGDQSEDLFLGHLNDSHYLSLRPSDWMDKWSHNAREMKRRSKTTRRCYTHDGRCIEEKYLGFEEMLDLNEELENQLLHQKDLIDILSMTPIHHLSFVVKNVIKSEYLLPVSWDFDKELERTEASFTQKTISVGTAAEKLAIMVCDRLSTTSANKKTKWVSPDLFITAPYHVVNNGEEVQNENTYLIKDSENVHSGYLRLQPATKTFFFKDHVKLDENNFAHVKQTIFTSQSRSRRQGNEQENSSVSVCIKCSVWPDETSEWFSRDRPSGWPNQTYMQKAVSKGCLIVSEAHPQSTSSDIEFMYSFGEAEKVLALGFLRYQKYCFHVFRLLIEMVTKGITPLRTYHIKTVFFHASEVIPRKYWRINPGLCLLYLISRFLSCLRCRIMPHYFIKENNIIDYFSDEMNNKLLKRIGSIREFPVLSVILLAEEHGLTSSWMADPIIEDIEHFCIDPDLKRSIFNVFVPTSLKLAERYVRYNMYNDTVETIMENYKNVKIVCSTNGDGLDMPPLFYFIGPLLTQLTLDQQWWLCLFLDLKHNEATMPFLTQNKKGKTILEMLGEDNEGELGHILVPFQVIANSSCPHLCEAGEESSDDADINFLLQFTDRLSQTEEWEICSHYHRCLVYLIKDKIKKDTSNSSISENVGNVEFHQTGNQSRHMNLTMLYKKLYSALIGLYHSYVHEDEPHLFQEFIHDLEDTCDMVATKCAYKNLSNIWLKLGSHEMSQQALNKSQKLHRCQ